MIIEIPNDNSIVKWKNNEKEDWKSAEISDLIKAYERPRGRWVYLQYDGNPDIGNWHCSECRFIAKPTYDFCPGCGIPMKSSAI